MLKSIMLIGLCFLAYSASASQIVEIETEFNDSRMNEVKIKFDNLANLANEHDQLSKMDDVRMKITKVTKGESAKSTIKQMVYAARSKNFYSKPDSVFVKAIETDDVEKSIELAISNLVIEKNSESEMQDLYESLDAVRQTKSYKVFVGSDGNTFGNCNWIGILAKRTNEFLAFGSCYSE